MRINDDLVPVVVSATEPTGHNRKKIWMQHSYNLCNPDLLYIFNSGNYIGTKYYGTIGSIPVKPNTTYKFYIYKPCADNAIYEYDKDGNRIKTTTSNPFTTASDCARIGFYFQQQSGGEATIENTPIMLVEQPSNSITLPYQPYIEDQYFILNEDTNLYDDFIPKNTLLKEKYTLAQIDIAKTVATGYYSNTDNQEMLKCLSGGGNRPIYLSTFSKSSKCSLYKITGSGYLEIEEKGTYMIFSQLHLQGTSSTSGDRWLNLKVNGTSIAYNVKNTSSVDRLTLNTAPYIIVLDRGDYISIAADLLTNDILRAGNKYSYLGIIKLD